MSSSRRLRRLALFAILIAGVGGWAWVARPWEEKPVVVSFETVTPAPASEVLAVNGRVVPGDEVDLGAQVSGQLTEVLVKVGDTVEKGAVLARLDDTLARSTVAQAEASLESARIDADAARTASDRAEALAGTVSATTRDSARFAAQAAEATVRQLEAALDQARQQLALYQVTSPIAGTVLDAAAEAGQVVGTTTTLFTVGDLANPLVETDVDEVYGARMAMGLGARVAPVGSPISHDAKVSFLAPTVNPETGGRTVRLAFDEVLETPLPSGLTMSVNIVTETFDGAITLPRTAIRDLATGPWVLRITEARAEKVAITVRDWPADRLIVTEGLAPGDRVITEPQDLAPGTLVSPAAEG